MRSRNLMESINYALRGIVQALQSQRNMKIHFLT
ncbi:MAG: diacylglycerol kinase, partial [Limnochordia bacterium]